MYYIHKLILLDYIMNIDFYKEVFDECEVLYLQHSIKNKIKDGDIPIITVIDSNVLKIHGRFKFIIRQDTKIYEFLQRFKNQIIHGKVNDIFHIYILKDGVKININDLNQDMSYLFNRYKNTQLDILIIYVYRYTWRRFFKDVVNDVVKLF